MKTYADLLSDDGLLILLLHGVISSQKHKVRNYTKKHITLDRFTQILEELKNARGAAVSMDDVLNKTWPARSFAVTFDDGFANNLTTAAPVLEEMKIPATFYITTNFVQDNTCSWIDQIEYALETCPSGRLVLSDIKLENDFSTMASRIRLLTEIRERVKSNPRIDPYRVAEEVLHQLNIKTIKLDPDLDQKLSWAQIQKMRQNPLFKIGGHGHTHRILSYLNDRELNAELNASFKLLEENIGQPITHYSYPEGLKHCYSPQIIKALQERGVRCCPSAEDGINKKDENLFTLKRVLVV